MQKYAILGDVNFEEKKTPSACLCRFSFHRTVVTLVNGIINPGAVGFNSEEAMAATNLSVDRHAKVRAVVLDVSEDIPPCRTLVFFF